MKKGFLLGLATGILLTGVPFALASSQIEAILNDQIKVSLDGQVQEFKDETTNETQYPITYKDRTYLPLRTVANLVGVGVDYDATTNTALLTTRGSETSSIIGFWKNDELGYDFVYTFNEDNTGNYDAAGIDMPFTYSIDGDKLSILYSGDTETFDTVFEIKNNVLNVKDSAGNDTLYNRTDSGVAINIPKERQTGTAGSNIPLKDNNDEAEYQIKVAMQYLLEETYGDKIFDARIYVEKIYTAEDEEKTDVLKDMKLGPNEVAFEVKYEIKPAEGVDPIIFTAGTGTYDKETGWVVEKYNLGVLRPAESGEQKYKITDFGTGW